MKTNILIAAVVLFCHIFIFSCTNTPWHKKQADLFLKSGIALIEVGNYNSALKELLEAEKYSSGNPQIHYYLGIAYHGRGLRDKAMEEFKEAISLKKDYSEAHNYLGTIFMNMSMWEKAIDAFDKALENNLYETPVLALYNSGWAYYNLQNYDMALSKYQQALRQDPMSILQPQIEKNIGLIYIKQSNLVQAKEHFKKSVTLDPSLYDAHFFLAETYLKIKDTENARKSFQQVIKLAPQSPFGQEARKYLRSIK